MNMSSSPLEVIARLSSTNLAPGTVGILATLILASLLGCYEWLLPKPLRGIPFNPEGGKSLWGDVPDLLRDPEGLNIWAGKQLEKLKAPLCQVFMGPLSKPIVLLADFGEARDILVGRTDFDRSSYITNRFPLFGGFHLRMKTGDAWKHSRQWLRDLMTPHFLNGVTAPAIYSEFIQLMQVWETKARLAHGKPFRISSDLKYVTIDVMLAFMFGADFQNPAHRTQIQQLARLDPSKLVFGKHDEIIFPKVPIDHFIEGICEVGEVTTQIYATPWPPRLVSWWTRHMSQYKKFFDVKDSFIRTCIQRAVQRLQDDNVETGVDHMVLREKKLALKLGQQPKFGTQRMIDEVRSLFFRVFRPS